MSDQNPIVTVLGGEELAVALNDGKLALVKVRQMPIRHVPRVLSVIEDEIALMKFVCRREDGTELNDDFIDTLTDESHIAIVEKARALNFHRAVAWLERQAAMAHLLAPAVSKMPTLPSSSAKPS